MRALRLLLARLARRGRLILFIDDVQWGDADSASLLASLLEPPTSPEMMLLITYREEYRQTSACIRELRRSVLNSVVPGFRGEIEVGDLDPTESRSLASELLGPGLADSEVLAERIAGESGGNPLFLSELARLTRDRPGQGPLPASGLANLDEVLWERVCRLPPDARRLLETLAVASRPLTLRLAQVAAGVPLADYRLLAGLRQGHLLRSTGPRLDDQLTTYHDRVRESILTRLPPAVLRQHHAYLAEALAADPRPEPDTLAYHHHQAGNLDRALGWYLAAADQASTALAFDRAANLYRTALQVSARLGGEPPGLRERMADALANLGRGPEAAEEYLNAAVSSTSGADRDATLRLRRKAAFQFCISGHVDKGRSAFREVLRTVGEGMPTRPLTAALRVMALRAWLRLRGLKLGGRADRPPSQADLDRLDILRSVAVGISVIDPMVGAYFQTRGTLLALKAGEPYRAALSLAWEAAHASLAGRPGRGVTDQLLRAAADLVAGPGVFGGCFSMPKTATEAAGGTADASVNHPHAAALVELARGIAYFMEGRYREVHEHCRAAELVFDARCTDVPWERVTSRLFGIWGLLFMGDYAGAREKTTDLYRECAARGDRYMMTNLGTQVNTLLSLAADRPAEALRNLDAVMALWTRVGFNVQHHGEMMARSYIAQYSGDGLGAWRLMRAHALAYHTSLLTLCQQIRVDRLAAEGRAAIAAYRQTGKRGWLRVADRRSRRLEREHLPWAVGMAALARAATADLRGERNHAIAHLRRAVQQFEQVPMLHLIAVTRQRLGQLLGPVDGLAEREAAGAWFARHGVGDPERFTAMWAPGLGERQ